MDAINGSGSKEELAVKPGDDFVSVKNIDQVKALEGSLVQFHYPARDDYYIGRVDRVKDRVGGRRENVFLRIYLKDYSRRNGLPYDMVLYNRLMEGGKLDSGTILQYRLDREVAYKEM